MYNIHTISITKEEIKKVAQLARLDLTSSEEDRYADTISSVLDYMKILNEVDVQGVEPTAQVTGLENVTREDIPIKCKISAELIAAMPVVKDEELVVPAVFE